MIRKIKAFWNSIIDTLSPPKKVSITLELNDQGSYVVKAYGMYLINTLTNDKVQAEKNFNDAVDHAMGKDKMNHVVIKEATITKK